jgi:hypothetical protein
MKFIQKIIVKPTEELYGNLGLPWLPPPPSGPLISIKHSSTGVLPYT